MAGFPRDLGRVEPGVGSASETACFDRDRLALNPGGETGMAMQIGKNAGARPKRAGPGAGTAGQKRKLSYG
jgi:hypothetical protein